MKVYPCKKCNICGEEVATKYGLFYRTHKYYVTLRSDSAGYEDPTIKGEVHICEDCWLKLKIARQDDGRW